eukprot:9469129-Pyramimonas_sp.AAC.1
MDNLSPPTELTQTTDLLRQIAREARDRLHGMQPSRGDVLFQVAKSISRAVRRQDRQLAARLLRSRQVAQEHVQIN